MFAAKGQQMQEGTKLEIAPHAPGAGLHHPQIFWVTSFYLLGNVLERAQLEHNAREFICGHHECTVLGDLGVKS